MDIELLAPSGDFNKLKTAFHFGADAVYVGGQSYGLRAGAKNFDYDQLKLATEYAHNLNKKVYLTCNIFAYNKDFVGLEEYIKNVLACNIDALIISDAGILAFVREKFPNAEIHLSTQANTTNKYSAKFWADFGVKRIVLAREMSLNDIKELRDFLPNSIELEAFVHGAMCISYSGRCLLSNFLTQRDGNQGKCVQACRWEYEITESNRKGEKLTIGEDGRGTYLLNSKDLNMLEYMGDLIKSGITSFKVEGRMKSQYYVASVINAYRRVIDGHLSNNSFCPSPEMVNELNKNSHRAYTTGFYFGEYDSVCLTTSQPDCDYEFIAEVIDYDNTNQLLKIEMRNRFRIGDTLEILSINPVYHNKTFVVKQIIDEKNNNIDDAKLVQQVLQINCEYPLQAMDILRIKLEPKADN